MVTAVPYHRKMIICGRKWLKIGFPVPAHCGHFGCRGMAPQKDKAEMGWFQNTIEEWE